MSVPLDFTDDDIMEELKKMGYSYISRNLLKKFKEDLRKLIQQEQNQPIFSPSSLSSLTPINSSSSEMQSSCIPQPIVINGRDKFEQMNEQTYPKMLYKSSTSDTKWKNVSEVMDGEACLKEDTLSSGPLTSLTEDDSIHERILNDETIPDIRWKRDKITIEMNGEDASKENVNSASNISLFSSRGEKIIKRKIASFKNGKLFITEEERIVSSNTGSPYPEMQASDKEQSRPGSRTDDSSSSQRLSGSDQMQPRYSSRQVLQPLPAMSISRRKCDPVTRYHQYRKFWETFKPPGEQSHKDLRWNIRGKMLEYNI